VDVGQHEAVRLEDAVARLDGYSTAAPAVPEPAMIGLLGTVGIGLLAPSDLKN